MRKTKSHNLKKIKLDTDPSSSFQLVAIELVEYEAYEKGFPCIFSHDLSDSIFRQKIGLYPLFFFCFFSCLFFYESQALHRQLCSGICYFLVTLLVLHMLFFGVFASNYAFGGGGGQTVCCLLFAINGWIFAAVMLYSSVMHY